MKRLAAVLLAASGTLSATIASAATNANLGCYGVADQFGQLAPLLDTSSANGKIDLARISKLVPGAVLVEPSSGRSQRLSYIDKSRYLPGADGVMHAADLRQDFTLTYDHGKLKSLRQRTTEEGKAGDVILGRDIAYDWKGDRCLPSHVQLMDRAQLGKSRGIQFDRKLCDGLKGAKISPQDARACVDTSRKALQVLADFDHQARKDSNDEEFLVATNPYVPGSVWPLTRLPESSQALALLDTCAQVDAAVNPPKAPSPNVKADGTEAPAPGPAATSGAAGESGTSAK